MRTVSQACTGGHVAGRSAAYENQALQSIWQYWYPDVGEWNEQDVVARRAGDKQTNNK